MAVAALERSDARVGAHVVVQVAPGAETLEALPAGIRHLPRVLPEVDFEICHAGVLRPAPGVGAVEEPAVAGVDAGVLLQVGFRHEGLAARHTEVGTLAGVTKYVGWNEKTEVSFFCLSWTSYVRTLQVCFLYERL